MHWEFAQGESKTKDDVYRLVVLNICNSAMLIGNVLWQVDYLAITRKILSWTLRSDKNRKVVREAQLKLESFTDRRSCGNGTDGVLGKQKSGKCLVVMTKVNQAPRPVQLGLGQGRKPQCTRRVLKGSAVISFDPWGGGGRRGHGISVGECCHMGTTLQETSEPGRCLGCIAIHSCMKP